MKSIRFFLQNAFWTVLILTQTLHGQFGSHVSYGTIDFAKSLHPWDGFGINYVESCQTLNYSARPQDLGGFTILNKARQDSIIELIFGPRGLRPSIVKLFLDPWHLEAQGGSYNHEWSTRNMRYFVSEGLKKTRAAGDSISIITTLYGPPAFMTTHHSITLSKLNPDYKKDLALYMIDWIKYLKKHQYPVHYLSIHNEGTDWLRWPHYENHPNAIQLARDYNLLWRPGEIADYLAYLKPVMEAEGLSDIGLTPGEPINLFRFSHFGMADAIASCPDALNSIDLITSHGFGLGNGFGRGYSNTGNAGAALLQKTRPELKTWITSMSWGKMNTIFAAEIIEHIYSNQASAIIPWAGVQRSSEWGDKNKHAGCAINVLEDSTWQVNKGYYLYQQMTAAGRPGMRIARTTVNRPDVFMAAFAQDTSTAPDAFVVVNLGESLKYTSDMVELQFTVNKHSSYYCFPYKDPVLAYQQDSPEQMNHVEFASAPTDDGYIMEFAFPWSTLGGQSDVPAAFSMDVQARDGRDMPQGRIGWLGDTSFTGKTILDKTLPASKGAILPKRTNQAPVIDGQKEAIWSMPPYPIENDLMPGTPPLISGHWFITWDDTRLYLLVHIIDPTNKQGRPMEIEVKNSRYQHFQAWRTDEMQENFRDVGTYTVKNGCIDYLSPNHSVTTFIGID